MNIILIIKRNRESHFNNVKIINVILIKQKNRESHFNDKEKS